MISCCRTTRASRSSRVSLSSCSVVSVIIAARMIAKFQKTCEQLPIGYEEASKVKAPTPLPLLFIVLPMVYHKETADLISSTLKASGLRNYVNKFSDTKTSKSDLVY